MAAVYSGNKSSLQSNNESSFSEYEKTAVQVVSTDIVSNSKTFNAENTNEEMDLSPSGPILKAQDHAEVVATDAALPYVKIKVEEVDDDDEIVAVHLDEAREEGLGGRATKKKDSSEGDKTADGDGLFRCEDCSETFEKKEVYVEHRSKHIHDGPIVCLDTDSQWDDMLVSMDGDQRTWFCALCGQQFSSSKGFFNHQLQHRNQAIQQGISPGFNEGMVKPKAYECKDCGKTFSSTGQCLNHQRSHKQASKSVFHQLAHLKKKSFQCPTCGRCYSRASALDAHRRCHEVKLVKSKSCETTEKPPSLIDAPGEAESCDASPEQTGDKQQKVFLCICGRSFRTMCGLGTHQRFSRGCSEGERKVKEKPKLPFECSECEKSFVSPVALSCHQRWHKRRAQSFSSGQSFKCKECGRKFTSLTFYNKHQRLAHSKELPAKSFLHQVCQLKKNAFECQECGRRFSRASALQSHQLCHTEVFRGVLMKGSETSALKVFQNEANNTDNITFGATVYSQDVAHTDVSEKDCDKILDGDYEIVRITAPDYVESNSGQDQNPDLELVCESDQEDSDRQQTAESTPSALQLSPEIDVKIVQIDYEHVKDETLVNDERSKSPSQESKKYYCSHCDQMFVNAVSLHHHLLWHKGSSSSGRQRFRLLSPTRRALVTHEVSGHESSAESVHYFHTENQEDKVPNKSMTCQLEDLQKDNIKCEECGLSFSRLSALHSHQQNHKITKKPFACSQCNKSYLSANGLLNHQKVCCGRKRSDNNVKDESTKHFNPTKSLLGPKVHHCKKCGKGFWSLGAFCHHKQNHVQCADGETTRPDPENCHVRRKRKGRGRRPGQKRQHQTDSKEKYECEVCGKSYHMLACFLKHKLTHDGLQRAVKSFDYQVQQLKKNSYQCPDCGKGFSRAMALQFHMKSHGLEVDLPVTYTDNLPLSPEKLHCPICKAAFTCESLLQNHQNSCLKEEGNADYPQECEKTGIKKQAASSHKVEDVLVRNTDLGKEQKTVLSHLKYKCQDCSRSFSVIGALNFHKRIHDKAYASNMLKVQPAKQLKVTEVKTERSLAKPPFACTECGKYFSSNSALGTHKRWHKDKKFARFLSKSYRKCSKKSVDGGPYLCNLCGKGFFYLCVLRRHQLLHPSMATQHKQQQVDTVKSKDSFNCPDCQMSFSNGSLLTTHFEDSHGKLDETNQRQSTVSYTVESGTPLKKKCASKMNIPKQEKPKTQYLKCSYCPKRFLNVRGLRAHKWQKHLKVTGQPPASPEEWLYPCSSCKMPFASEEALHNHKKFCNANKKNRKPSKEEEPAQCTQTLEVTTKCLFKCDKCAKDFPSEEQLNAHKELTKSRPHSCALCCRGYWTEIQLQQHLAWHDEVRRRLPTELRYRLSASMAPGTLDKLKALPHRSTSMVQQPVPLANLQPTHKCQHCDKNFSSPLALQQHQALHKPEEAFCCSLCPQTFYNIRDLIDHHQECLGDKERKDSKLVSPEKDAGNMACIECGISFNQEEDLHQHYIAHARGEF